ncbi:MAG: hypothetical protein ACRDP6_47190 [Actinoallomurus sp.]
MSKHATPTPTRSASRWSATRWPLGVRVGLFTVLAAGVAFAASQQGLLGPTMADAAGAALGTHSVTNSKIAPGAVTNSKIHDNAVSTNKIRKGAVHNQQIADSTITYKDLGPALRRKIDQIGQTDAGATFSVNDQGHLIATLSDGTSKDLGNVKGAKGDTGEQGQKGDDATLAVNGTTTVAARVDSGHHGNWATDTFTRTTQIVRQHAANTSHCGGAKNCWFYTATIQDKGTFKTTAGANSPGQGDATAINGVVNGDFEGGSLYEFYSSVDHPTAVPATEDGSHSSSTWMNLMFPNDAVYNLDQPDWAWSYTATDPAICEAWTNAKSNESGNITGVNHCPAATATP